MDKIKTRLKELEDMLMPDGDLNKNIYNAVLKLAIIKDDCHSIGCFPPFC